MKNLSLVAVHLPTDLRFALRRAALASRERGEPRSQGEIIAGALRLLPEIIELLAERPAKRGKKKIHPAA